MVNVKEFKEFTDFVLSIVENFDNIALDISSPNKVTNDENYRAFLDFVDSKELCADIIKEGDVYRLDVRTIYRDVLNEVCESKERIVELLNVAIEKWFDFKESEDEEQSR